MEANGLPPHIKCGAILFCRSKKQPFYIGRILVVDRVRRRCYARFEDNVTHWCEILDIQNAGFHGECHNPAVEDVHLAQWTCRVCDFKMTASKNHALFRGMPPKKNRNKEQASRTSVAQNGSITQQTANEKLMGNHLYCRAQIGSVGDQLSLPSFSDVAGLSGDPTSSLPADDGVSVVKELSIGQNRLVNADSSRKRSGNKYLVGNCNRKVQRQIISRRKFKKSQTGSVAQSHVSNTRLFKKVQRTDSIYSQRTLDHAHWIHTQGKRTYRRRLPFATSTSSAPFGNQSVAGNRSSSVPITSLKVPKNVIDVATIESVAAASSSIDIETASCLHNAINRHFGAVGRLKAGARCRITARRFTADHKVEYLVQWENGVVL